MIQLLIEPRRRNIGSFEVGRVLPFARRRMVGPFIFFDHLGPVDLPKGLPREADVRPHPHIGFPPSPTCSRVRSCTATPRAWSRRSDPAR
jgi:redox-sensitive bicupin YhaK (pirin superfamily)